MSCVAASTATIVATAESLDQNVVNEGDTIIIRMHDDKSTMMITVSRKEKQKIGRKKFFNVSCIIGAPYGSVFEVNGSNLCRVDCNDDEDDELDLLTNGDDDNNETSAASSSNQCADDEVGLIGGNKNFFDSNTAQKMNQDDIAALKKAGTPGVEIIKTLIANSDTFSSKTAFSQAKWIKRKKMKYCQRFRVVKASPMSLCDVYRHKSAAKIANLRWDTLAQILSHGGVYAGARVLIFDATLGLVVGSAAYRMRGFGHISAIYPGQQPHFDIVPRLNLDKPSVGIIEPVASSEICSAGEYIRAQGFLTSAQATQAVEQSERIYAEEKVAIRERKAAFDKAEADKVASAAERSATISDDGNKMDETSATKTESCETKFAAATSAAPVAEAAVFPTKKPAPAARGNSNKRQRVDKGIESSEQSKNGENNNDDDMGININNVMPNKPGSMVAYNSSNRNPVLLTKARASLRQGFTSFILCTSKHHHLTIVQHALPLLLPSSPFVLHCDAMEPLVECYNYLHNNDLALKMVLTDTWMREFQTLPGRVHPLMSIQASGGYLLTGIYAGSKPYDPAKVPVTSSSSSSRR